MLQNNFINPIPERILTSSIMVFKIILITVLLFYILANSLCLCKVKKKAVVMRKNYLEMSIITLI